MTIPKTPQERADDLRSVGAKIGKLPSFKRGEFLVECPRCGGCAVWDGRQHRFVPADSVASRKDSYKNDKIDVINLADETWHKGGVWEVTHKGHDKWLNLRLHVIACTGGELDDEAREGAVRAAHTLLARLRKTPEIAGPALRELAIALREWFADADVNSERFVDVTQALDETSRYFDAHPLPHRPEATREARKAKKAAEDERSHEAARQMLGGMRAAMRPHLAKQKGGAR